MEKDALCPVCEKHAFACDDDYDICPVCGWENDVVQRVDYDYWGGANDLSVNESKICFLLSKNDAKKDKLLKILDFHKRKKTEIHQKYKEFNYRDYSDIIQNEFTMEHNRCVREIKKLASE